MATSSHWRAATSALPRLRRATTLQMQSDAELTKVASWYDEGQRLSAAAEIPPPPAFLELLKFTVCAMPIYVSPTLLSLIDTAVIGQIGSLQLAALGPACAVCDALTGVMVFISVGTTNAVSTEFGKNDMVAAKRAASVSVLGAAAIGSVIAVLLSLSIGPATAALTLTSGRAQLWAACATYVRIRALSFPAALVLMAAQGARPRRPLLRTVTLPRTVITPPDRYSPGPGGLRRRAADAPA